MANTTIRDKRGFTLIELIVVIAIIGVLAALLIPNYIQYVEKAKESQLVQTATVIKDAAQVALTAQVGRGEDAGAQIFKTSDITGHQIKCGRLSNYWLGQTRAKILNEKKGNHLMALDFIDALGLKSSTDGVSTIPVSSTIPGTSADSCKGSMDDKVIFQVIFDTNYNILRTELSRDGYFVRIEDGKVTTKKLPAGNETCFTVLKQ